ncbi:MULTISPECIES: nicotinamide riboside transporter PnuC [Acinetobacter]|jgi:nicotinamide mononucleotide transporter|uniref:Nicotinamide riboside transporter PnuC n=1 Tax=Acinetobacter chengduensis TaxID=2420890 RepID=A0ABX9TVL6_9GAMM|nr:MULTISPECIES: nicotinamide riboside transporter PnuC [Acinetobacter]MBI1450922.1 nicotinamide mononucleotide transporter [Acinetobacter sp. FL51]RKG41213.1 nicotinamide riboside transporter PnuC [Acinetobacter sp. WCHAc060007]RLL21131.1 nicotinamide riboside transporter PnuC [Acinetobacter chengduensis]
MSELEIIAVVVSCIAVALTVCRHMLCWPFNLLAYVLYAFIFFDYKLYGETILQVLFMGLAVYGFLQWKQGKATDHDIRIEVLSQHKLWLQIIATAIFGAIFGACLKYLTDAAVPWLDAQLAAFSLLATYWTSRKYIATWVLWVVVDIIYVGMFIYKDLLLTAALYALFVLLAVYGWYTWLKVKHKQQVITSP